MTVAMAVAAWVETAHGAARFPSRDPSDLTGSVIAAAGWEEGQDPIAKRGIFRTDDEFGFEAVGEIANNNAPRAEKTRNLVSPRLNSWTVRPSNLPRAAM